MSVMSVSTIARPSAAEPDARLRFDQHVDRAPRRPCEPRSPFSLAHRAGSGLRLFQPNRSAPVVSASASVCDEKGMPLDGSCSGMLRRRSSTGSTADASRQFVQRNLQCG